MDLDHSPVSTAIVTSMRADTAFELVEVDEAQAKSLVRQGKVRAAAVFPAGFGSAAPKAMFRPGGKKPEVVLLYDPSQAMALAMLKGLLADHVMRSVSRAAFGVEGGTKALDELRAELRDDPSVDEGLRKELFALFDSVDRVRSRNAQAGNRKAAAAPQGLSMPFETREEEVAGRVDRRYNAFAHSFAGMGVQFVLFMGIEMGVGLLLLRRLGLWKRLRAAPVSRGLLL